MNNRFQAEKLIKAVCSYYNIKTLNKSNKNLCKVLREDTSVVYLSKIRMALGYFLYQHCPISLSEIGPKLGYINHATLSSQWKRIKKYIKEEDVKFYPYYLKIIDLASDLEISMAQERVFSKGKITFKIGNKIIAE